MRRALPLLLVALVASVDARAQSADDTAAAQPVAVQSCYPILTIYGFIPICTTTMVDPGELSRRQTEYLTNGASVLAVPTSGPAAAYFNDASKVLAAPTTSFVPTSPPTAAPVAPPSSQAPARAAMPPSASPAPEQPSAMAPSASSAGASDETQAAAPLGPAALAAMPMWGDVAIGAAEVEPATASPLPVASIQSPSPQLPSEPTSESDSRPSSLDDMAKRERPWGVMLAGAGALGCALLLVGALLRRRDRLVRRLGTHH